MRSIPERLPARWGLLADRDFRLLFLGETASKFGSSVTTVALPLIGVVELQVSAFTVAMLTASVWLPWLVLGLPAGVWVGQLPRRTVMLACNVVSAGAFASIPLAAVLDVLTVAHLLAVGLLAGMASVFFTTAYQVYLPELVEPSHLVEGNAKLQGSASAAQVAGPGVGGLLAQWLGAVTGLLVNAATFLLATLMLALIRAPGQPPEPRLTTRPSLLREVREGLRFTLRDPYLRTLTAFGSAANLTLIGYQSILVLFLVREVGVTPGLTGLLVSTGALGGILGAIIARPLCRRLGTARSILLSHLAAAPFGLLIPTVGNDWTLVLFVVGSLLLATGVMVCSVVSASFRQTYPPPHLLSRVVSTAMFVNYGTIPLGALLSGVLASVIGLRPTMWAMLILYVSCWTILGASPLRRRVDLPTSAVAQPAERGDRTAGAVPYRSVGQR
ncbi:MFS transporter [Salinispora vitiensis]|uniref:MFS transporter n=1 Tax=Salinispora vitiensis TaxID=999544 RepID=UPI0003A85753|nr:MFS transporter [Salinispora vitiensis]